MHLKPMLDVCTGLNSACAAADVILGATDKSDTLIAAVKEQLQPVRDEVLRTHTAAENQLGWVQSSHNQLQSLSEILQHWDASWKAQASRYLGTPATSAWYAKALPFNVHDCWTTAASGDHTIFFRHTPWITSGPWTPSGKRMVELRD